MNQKNFSLFLSQLKETNATLGSFVDFNKVNQNTEKILIKLNQLNYLLGKDNLEESVYLLFEENKAVFDLKQEERNTKNQRMIDLYGTIRNEEIRQEDFARADQKLADEIARVEKTDKAKALELEQERLDNVKEAIAKLGVTPVGETYDELLGEYATAVKNKPIDNKPFTVGKDSYVFDPATGKYILPP